LEEDKTLHAQSPMMGNLSLFQKRDLFAGCIVAGQSEIEEAKRYYKILDNPNSSIAKSLQIPIGRWIKSKTSENSVDKMIDLGIALESLFVPAKVPGKSRNISFNLKNNASRHLGRDKENREKLKKKFKAIYECRCDAVHEGKLDEEVEVEGNKIPMPQFIAEAQDLCRQSILKILEDGKFPIGTI